jgi:DNA-binding transcriptional MerR regulator
MSKPEVNPDKLFYSIGEVADMFGVNTSLIRFWEKEFNVIKLQKNKKGNRLFTKKDIETFRLIYHLVKEKGLTLAGAREKLKGGTEVANDQLVVSDTLKKLRSFLLELKEQM